ncbi:MAG: DUF2442 domain-containing protein [Bdellovibrionales bacterium]
MSRTGTEFSDNLQIIDITYSRKFLQAELSDHRIISVPLHWYPRLERANAAQRDNWKLVGHGYGVHWPDVDEDISVKMIIEGLPSLEARHIDA